MSGGPKNAGLSGDGFRFYRWECNQSPENLAILRRLGVPEAALHEPTDVLSVTSIRKLTGEPYNLVAWQLSNIVNVAMGMTQRIIIGPRGGKNKTYVLDGEFPGSFIRQMLAGEGKSAELHRIREWMRATADRPRDTAAVRGTIVHEAIELNIPAERIDQAYVEAATERLSSRDRQKIKSKGGVTKEDVDFVAQAVAQYWDMRVNVPFIVIANEPQVWNLTAGYAGSADVLIWFLGEWVEVEVGRDEHDESRYEMVFEPLPGIDPKTLSDLGTLAKAGRVTQAMIERVGGHVCLGDWKTSEGLHTDQVVQVHAYLGTEFIGADGLVDERLTDILTASKEAAIIHIRPDGWGVHLLDFKAGPLRAFLGSVAFARFVAAHPEPQPLFKHSIRGAIAV